MNTKEFAKLCNVEKRTLFHYDQIGLLKPARVKENGYREYDLQQLDEMDAIKIFQSSGYTLQEIKQILNSPLNLRMDYIAQARSRLAQKIESLSQMEKYLRSKEEFIHEVEQLGTNQCRIEFMSFRYDFKDLPAENFHRFNFLSDGTYSSFVMEKDKPMKLVRIYEHGAHLKQGIAITFFLEIESTEPHLEQLILNQLMFYEFHGEDVWYAENLPHFFLDDTNHVLLKVTVFQKNEENDKRN